MGKGAIRRIQIVAFALSHIPLAAIVMVTMRDGPDGDATLIATCVIATLVAALLLVAYLGYSLSRVFRHDRVAFDER